MARRKREPMNEGKKNIIGMLLEEYDMVLPVAVTSMIGIVNTSFASISAYRKTPSACIQTVLSSIAEHKESVPEMIIHYVLYAAQNVLLHSRDRNFHNVRCTDRP